jgi:hypothetical protein
MIRDGQPSSREVGKRELSVKSSAKLAEALGFTRNLNEKARWYREYSKPLETGELITLAFQDGDADRGGERIIIGVKRGEKSRKNDKEYYLCHDVLFDEAMEKLGLSKNTLNMFLKSELKNGGYSKLYRFLLELEKSGFYEDQLKKLAEG